MKVRRRGRPPGPAGSCRSKRVVSFVTEQELLRINQLCSERNQALSAVIHSFIAQGLSNEVTSKDNGQVASTQPIINKEHLT